MPRRVDSFITFFLHNGENLGILTYMSNNIDMLGCQLDGLPQRNRGFKDLMSKKRTSDKRMDIHSHYLPFARSNKSY